MTKTNTTTQKNILAQRMSPRARRVIRMLARRRVRKNAEAKR